eukprot:GHUV01055166.1.p1 GENE.GHUV01055166.1~~GHUV01055166.1.p1  ORF type:complete len:176 (-),score=32.71 GHUV01055166.1:284-811(-)
MFGMSLKGLDKEIIYSEYGLGGGKTGDYRTPADSSYTVAASPYWGVDGVYSSAMDPWQKSDNRQFMQQYYQLTTEYAKRGGVNYPVRITATLLNCTYMDTYALYPCRVAAKCLHVTWCTRAAVAVVEMMCSANKQKSCLPASGAASPTMALRRWCVLSGVPLALTVIVTGPTAPD